MYVENYIDLRETRKLLQLCNLLGIGDSTAHITSLAGEAEGALCPGSPSLKTRMLNLGETGPSSLPMTK